MIREINTTEDIALFAYQLVNEAGLNLHPDNDFRDYINTETMERIYSDEEASGLNFHMGRCFNICEQTGVDIYELMGKPLFDKLNLNLNI